MRLEVEVHQTLPPPLNVVLRLFFFAPPKLKDQLIFVIMLLLQYIPSILIMTTLALPYVAVNLIIILLNPFNYYRGHGNPFAGSSTIHPQDGKHSNLDDLLMGVVEREQGFSVARLRQFYDDNFTDVNDEMMRGEKDSVSFNYNSRDRVTIVNQRAWSAKSLSGFADAIQSKRDSLHEVLSLSNGNTVSMITEVAVNQAVQNEALESATKKSPSSARRWPS